MGAKGLTISVQVRRVWYGWLLWPVIRWGLLAAVRLRLLAHERAYWLGARYLAGILRVRCNEGPWQRIEVTR